MINALNDDLRRAAEGAGLTPDVVSDLPELGGLELVHAVAARDRCSRGAAGVAVVQTAVDRLTGAEGRRKRVLRASIARAALGLGEYANVYGLHVRLGVLSADQLSLATMRDFWKSVCRQVAQAIMDLNLQDIPTTNVDADDRGSPHFTSTSTDVLWTLDGARVVRADFNRELVARGDELRTFDFPVSYPLDARDGVIFPEARFNCEVVATRFGGDGRQTTTVALPRTRPGQTVHFGYSVVIDSPKDDLPYLRHYCRWTGGSLSLAVQFGQNRVPGDLWSFQALDMSIDPTIRRPTFSSVPVSSMGYARVRFERELVTTGFGLGWNW